MAPVLVFCVLYAVAGVFACVDFRFLADRFWPATVLLYSPRWMGLLPLLVLLPMTRRRKRLWILPLLTGLFVLGPVMNFHIPWHRFGARPIRGRPIRLLTCNVHRLELDVPKLDQYVLATQPDIVVLQDYSGWDDSPVFSSGWNVYRLGEIFIATRYPIHDAHDLDLQSIPGVDDWDFLRHPGAAACFDLETPTGIVHVLNLHLASPHKALSSLLSDTGWAVWKLKANTARRANESQKLTDYLATLHGPVIIAGDFNTPPESPVFRWFWSSYDDAFLARGIGYGYTHYWKLSALRLDHILYSSEVRCILCQIGPECGSPHRPLVSDLVIE
jgi:endonuclease/exonuclease/phosphatase (EEP) superfamily protein YafD